jgi:hypothetical protein
MPVTADSPDNTDNTDNNDNLLHNIGRQATLVAEANFCQDTDTGFSCEVGEGYEHMLPAQLS